MVLKLKALFTKRITQLVFPGEKETKTLILFSRPLFYFGGYHSLFFFEQRELKHLFDLTHSEVTRGEDVPQLRMEYALLYWITSIVFSLRGFSPWIRGTCIDVWDECATYYFVMCWEYFSKKYYVFEIIRQGNKQKVDSVCIFRYTFLNWFIHFVVCLYVINLPNCC